MEHEIPRRIRVMLSASLKYLPVSSMALEMRFSVLALNLVIVVMSYNTYQCVVARSLSVSLRATNSETIGGGGRIPASNTDGGFTLSNFGYPCYLVP